MTVSNGEDRWWREFEGARWAVDAEVEPVGDLDGDDLSGV